MNEQELNELSREEIHKLYNQGKLSDKEVESLPIWKQDKLKAKKKTPLKKIQNNYYCLLL